MQRFIQRRRVLRAIGLSLPLALFSRAVRPALAEAPDAADIFIGELEKRIIASYYQRRLYAYQQSPEWHEYKKNKGNGRNKNKGLPPGIAKKGTLPPGIAKQLTRNGHLPPGLDHQPLPHDLIVQLPPLQPGYQYRIVDDRVLLIQAASNLILDVLTVAALEVLD